MRRDGVVSRLVHGVSSRTCSHAARRASIRLRLTPGPSAPGGRRAEEDEQLSGSIWNSTRRRSGKRRVIGVYVCDVRGPPCKRFAPSSTATAAASLGAVPENDRGAIACRDPPPGREHWGGGQGRPPVLLGAWRGFPGASHDETFDMIASANAVFARILLRARIFTLLSPLIASKAFPLYHRAPCLARKIFALSPSRC